MDSTDRDQSASHDVGSSLDVRSSPQAPEGAEWFVTIDYPYRPSSGPIIVRMTEDGRRLDSFEDAEAYGRSLLSGEPYTQDRTAISVGWQLPLRHADGQF